MRVRWKPKRKTYHTNPRLLEALIPIHHEFWSNNKFPASTTITVHSLPAGGLLLEISAIAVIGDVHEH